MWIFLALLTAFLIAAREAITKRAMDRGDEYVLAFGVAVYTGLFLLPLSLILGTPRLAPSFWWALLVSGSVNSVAAVLIPRAVHISDLSLVSPLQSFTPLFMLLTSPLILGEVPSALGLLGVLTIVGGSYLLTLPDPSRSGFWAPMKALLRNRGARLMLVVAFLFSISANVDKVGVLASDPVFWGVAVSAFIAVSTFLPMLLARRSRFSGTRKRLSGENDPWVNVTRTAERSPDTSGGQRLGARAPKPLWMLLPLIGLVMAGATVAQMTAITMTLAAYVIATKRTSIVFGVLAGHVFFQEEGLSRRLAGSVIMLAGVVMITLA
jgi:drug/metabolite transporter (DMT)-like permease